jgi:hypothetical protein
MAAVKIIRDPVCTDAASEIPREKWPTLLRERSHFCREVIPHDCRLLLFFIEDAAKADWLGYGTRNQYLRALGLDPKMVKLALRGLRIINPKIEVGFDEAIVLGRRQRGIAGGKAGPGRGHKTADNVSRLKYGNSRAYVLARLERDGFGELLAKVQNGELSANAAAIEVGFRKKSKHRCPQCGFEF